MSTARRLLMLVAILPGFCAYLAISSSVPSQAREEAPPVPTSKDGGDRLREGTALELVGTFQATGDRIMFYGAPDHRRFGTLENLNLERISRMISDSSDTLEWSVSGTVTEFQGANYLLVTRAVLKSKPPRRSLPKTAQASEPNLGSL